MRAAARLPRRCSQLPELRVIPVEGLPEIVEGDDLGELIAEQFELVDADVVVVSQKVVSKAEGRIVRLDDVEPSAAAHDLAGGHDARHLEVILSEAARIVRSRPPLVIAETRHGFVCASAGVDSSNAPEPGTLVLLPVDPDASAATIREKIGELTGRDVGVLVSDSFGRPFRTGIVDVAIGVAGIAPLADWRGQVDPVGHELTSTVIAVADEIAAAAELVMGKLAGVPAAVVRGLEVRGVGSARELIMPPERNLFT
jgi:coenzyme F420-0:L-glutamate ligase / coenzyme F420-1:gamma-L-glutamate ligase